MKQRFISANGDPRRSSDYGTPKRPSDRTRLLLLQKLFRLDACLLEDGAQRALGHVAGMVGDGGEPARARVIPDLMAAGGLAMKLHPECLQSPGDVAVAKAGEATHQVATITG